MKIEDARRCWCPMSRVWEESNRNGFFVSNRSYKGVPVDGSYCLVDDCMMWVEDDSIDGQYGHCGLVKS